MSASNKLFAPASLPVSTSSSPSPSSSSSYSLNDIKACRKQLLLFYLDRELIRLSAKQQNDNDRQHLDLTPDQTAMLKRFTPDEQRAIAAEAYANAQQQWDADIRDRRRPR